MAGVRLEFAQFGHFDYYNIYRNSVSTALENLGVPIGTSLKMYYEDLTVEPNRDYYYRIGVIRDSTEKFSEEFHVKTLVEFDPPYDLVIEFRNDETNRLELNWNLDGFVDEQRYYCSEMPIDPENLPLPKAVFAGDARTYVDTAVEVGKTYFVRVSTVRNGVEKLSDQVSVIAQDRIYRVQLNVTNSNLLNSYGTLPLTWSQSGVTLIHANNEIQHTSAASYLKSNESFPWSSDWDVEFDAYIDSSASNAYYSLVGNRHNSEGSGRILLYFGGSGSGSSTSKFCIGIYGANALESSTQATNTWHKVRYVKTGNRYSLTIDGVLQFADAQTNTGASPTDGVINFGLSGAGVRIRNFIIH